jgi:tetratricopeptide (TPR) repeat protein
MFRRISLPVAALLLLAGRSHSDRSSAQQALADGDARHARGDLNGAIEAYGKAAEADPGWAAPWGRRALAKLDALRVEDALPDFGRAIALEPDSYEWRIGRAQALLQVDRAAPAIDDMDALLRKFPGYPDALAIRGLALVLSGDVDAGLAEQDAAFRAGQNDPRLRMRAEGLLRRAEWAALLAEVEGRERAGIRDASHAFYRVVALTESGQYDRAAEAVAALARGPRTNVLAACRVWLASTPEAGRHCDPAAAERELPALAADLADSNGFVTQARSLFLAGRPRAARDLLTTRGRRTHFGTLLWLGACSWKIGELEEARAYLRDAVRLNPYLARHAARIPDFADFAASVEAEVKGELQGGDRAKLGQELATHLLTVAEIETLVRAYRFAKAAEEYEKLLKALASAARRAEVEARLPEVRGMAGALAKAVARVNKADPKLRVRSGKSELTLVKADDASFDFALPGGGGRFPWAALDVPTFLALASDASPAPEEILGLACLAWDAGERAAAAKLFEEAAKKKPALRAGVNAFVARRRGLSAPKEGFLLWRGGYVTAEEKSNLEKGLVRFEGAWVAAADREKLARGLVKVGEKWVNGDEADLLKRGFRRYKGQWMSAEDLAELRSNWDEAWTEETAHCRIRTNHSEAFAKDLALLAEAAWAALKSSYGEEPKEKAELFAFRSYEDYRRHCLERNAADRLNAAGFATSDSNVVCGWNKTRDDRHFLQTMSHELAHLFWFRVSPAARTPSWLAEGMATAFEGFQWDGRGYRFTFVSESRLPIVRAAAKAGRHIPLKEALEADALALINADPQRALLFYAECWSLHWFLTTTTNGAWKAGYAEFRKEVARGGHPSLERALGDLGAVEKEWIAAVSGM